MRTRPNGFSVTELLVCIAVLGALTAIAVPSWQKMETRASYQATMHMLLGSQALIMGVRPVEKKTVLEMSRTLCLFCEQGFLFPKDMEGFVPGWDADIKADWEVWGYSTQPYDAWDHALIADANEMEFDPNDCRHDAIWSAGANGVWDGVGGTGDTASGDDAVVTIPFFRQTRERCPGNFF